MKRLFLLLMIAVLAGCDDYVGDCLDYDGPEFDQRSVPIAVLNQEYSTIIVVYLENEPFDDRYYYDIEFSGALPQGIQVIDDFNDRTVNIQGTPTQLGSFTFELYVRVFDPYTHNGYYYDPHDPFADGDNLCYSTNRETFTLSVMEDYTH